LTWLIRMKEIQLLGLLLVLVILILCFVKALKEGFTFDKNKKMHDDFSSRFSKKLNNVGVLLTSAKNEAALGDSTRDIFGSVQDTMDANNVISQNIDDPYPAEGGISGMSLVIKQCELVKSTDCNIFDKPTFSKDCGLCLDFGRDSEDKPQIGGMVLTAKDKEYAQSQRKGNFLPAYSPTVGSCPTGMMVATKAECLRLQNELTCKKNGTMDSPAGCSQCYDDGVYHVVDSKMDPNLIVGTGTLMIVGSGTLTWSESGTSNTGTVILSPTKEKPIPLAGAEYSAINLDIVSPPIPRPYDSSKVYNVNDLIIFKYYVYKMLEGAGAPGFDPSREGDQLWSKLVPYAQYVPPPPTFIAGYLESPDGNSFQPMDLYRLIMNDSMTGRKPRTMGQMNLDTVTITKMGLGYGKKAMKLVAYSPFTFVDPLTQEASLCPSSPYITKPASARFMGSDPCYARGTGPGNYNLACLQQTFINNGCGTSLATLPASGYPSNAEKAAVLLMDKDGRELPLDEIATKIYQYALSTSTGLDANGKKLTMNAWSAASVFCTGVPINSPCDALDEDGRLTDDCIVYLWDNQGENKIPKNTYSLTSFARSLFDTGTINRFCTRDGTYSPIDSSNTPNVKNLEYWKNQGNGTVNAVKAAMSQLHLDANTNLTREEAKAPFVKQCYGIVPNPRPGFKSGYEAVKGSTLPIANTIIKDNIILPDNYDFTLSFDITPYRIIPDTWGGILRVTTATTPDVWPPGYGVRNTMFVFFPGSTALHFVIGNHDNLNDYEGWNWLGGIYPPPFAALPLNKKTTVSVKTAGQSVMITVAGVTKTYTQPTKRMYSRTPDETYNFYVSDNSFPAANAVIENIKYTVNDTIILQTSSVPAISIPGQSM
jgi:hypothetical protein